MSYAGSVVTESLTCSICSELLNEPKLLSCTHTFCKKCLNSLISSQHPGQDQFPCPTCRQVTRVEDRDVSKLQTNVPINSLLEELKSTRKYCTICDAGSKSLAQVYCWQCNEFLCQSCHVAHGKFKKISNHDVVNVSDVKSGKVRMKHFCDLHPHEELEFVCSPCKAPICFRCRVLDHSGGDHQVVDILAFQKSIQSEARKLSGKSEGKMSAIEAHIGHGEEHLIKVGRILDERVAEIHQAYEDCLQKVTKHLAKRKDELSDEIQRQRQLMIKELEDITGDDIKSLSHIRSLYETVTKAADGFLEGDALVVHNKVCKELEEMLKKDDPDKKGVDEIGQRAEGLKLKVYQGNHIFRMPIAEVYQAYGNQSALSPHIASIKGDLDWNLEKMNSLSVAGAKFADMAPTPDGKMAVGYELGGIDVFSLHGLDEKVLHNVKVNSVAVLCEGQYVVRDTNYKVTVYARDWNQLSSTTSAGNGKLYVDQKDNLYVNNCRDGKVCSIFKLVPIGDDGKKLKFEKVRDITPGGLNELIPLNHENNQFIRADTGYYVRVLDEKKVILYERLCGRRVSRIAVLQDVLRIAVLQDDTILIGREEGGLVTVERYTSELRYLKTVLTEFKIDGESFKLSEFSTGEIALCDGKALQCIYFPPKLGQSKPKQILGWTLDLHEYSLG